MVSDILYLLVALSDYGDHTAMARLHLLHIADDFLIEVVVGSDDHSRHLGIDKSDRPVLHLGCGITLGMDVGNLLKLERALESNRIAVTASEVKEIMGIREDKRQALDLVVEFKSLLHVFES